MATHANRAGSWIGGTLLGAIIVGASWGVAAAQAQSGPAIATLGNTVIHASSLNNEMAKSYGSETLTNLITQQLITDAAKKDHVTATSADVQTALTSLEQQNGITSEAQLEQALAGSNMTLAQLQSQLKLQVLAQKIAASEVTVTPTEIAQYYAKNKKTLEQPAKVSLSAIFFKNQATADSV
ncbi:MAG: SurA N-terminal domain-containing protein, partial [Firmicutes bacterium]|nr:SurA N-terminal domain-containing protein [Bacillota bacterium]